MKDQNRLVLLVADLGKTHKNYVHKSVYLNEASDYLKYGWKFAEYNVEYYYYIEYKG